MRPISDYPSLYWQYVKVFYAYRKANFLAGRAKSYDKLMYIVADQEKAEKKFNRFCYLNSWYDHMIDLSMNDEIRKEIGKISGKNL